MHDPKNSPDSQIRAAYQIARLIRNAFAHAPFFPTWSIDEDCREQVFSIPDLIELKTAGLHGNPFDWHHYGGPLALFRLGRFVRTQIVKDVPPPRTVIPIPQRVIYQQGNLIMEKINNIPEGAVEVELPARSDCGVDLGDGHVLHPTTKGET